MTINISKFQEKINKKFPNENIQCQYDEYKRNYAKEKLIVISYIDFDNIENILSEKLLSSTTTLNEVAAKQSAAK